MATETNKSRGARLSKYAFIGLAWALVACIVIQTFIAGYAVFTDPSHWSRHVSFVHIFEFVPILMLIFAFAGKLSKGLRWQSFGLFALIYSQYFTANLPGAGALHLVIALALFWFAVVVAKKASRE